jgi:CBS domain-containing protein
MKIREVMTSQVRCAVSSDSMADVAAEMKRLNVGTIPICEGDRLVGIVTDRDIAIGCVATGLDPKACKVGDHMTCNPITIGPDQDLAEAFRLMAREQVHRLPVIDKNEKIVGMLSLGDCVVNCSEDQAVANLVRHISVPVRSAQPFAAAA